MNVSSSSHLSCLSYSADNSLFLTFLCSQLSYIAKILKMKIYLYCFRLRIGNSRILFVEFQTPARMQNRPGFNDVFTRPHGSHFLHTAYLMKLYKYLVSNCNKKIDRMISSFSNVMSQMFG